jgi:ribosomal protein S6--L-glutamate ligase
MLRNCYRAKVATGEGTTAREGARLALPVKNFSQPKIVIGRREWIRMPRLGIDALNAKTDSGARSSSLHAEGIELSKNKKEVKFFTRDHDGRLVTCVAPVGGKTRIKSSTGISRRRIWIFTDAVLPGGFRWRVRLTLADRDRMNCRMLIGRQAISGYFLIDTQGAHLCGGLHDFL